jgi:hypothetical protein
MTEAADHFTARDEERTGKGIHGQGRLVVKGGNIPVAALNPRE